MDTDESYSKLKTRAERLLVLVRQNAPFEIIFNEIMLLHNMMPEFEEAYIKWVVSQAKRTIEKNRNTRRLCSECPAQLGDGEEIWCEACGKQYDV
jgi:hypothetical protein